MSRVVEVRITGRVQGVGFRLWTRMEARRRDLAGWVRNEADGSVSALLSGPGDEVEDMLRALRHGPPSARVDDVRAEIPASEPALPHPFETR
ncbi:MAG: acylphosphatase [Tranquillimonas sp.]